MSYEFYLKNIQMKRDAQVVKDHIKSCDACQHHKVIGMSHYSQMPLVSSQRDEEPFENVNVDCAGP